jgi:hypothetical protein
MHKIAMKKLNLKIENKIRKQDLLQGFFWPTKTYQSFQKVPLMMIVRRWHFSLDLIKSPKFV